MKMAFKKTVITSEKLQEIVPVVIIRIFGIPICSDSNKITDVYKTTKIAIFLNGNSLTIFMVTPCINTHKYFINQLMHLIYKLCTS